MGLQEALHFKPSESVKLFAISAGRVSLARLLLRPAQAMKKCI